MSAFATWLAGRRIRRAVIVAGLYPFPPLNILSAATVVMSASLRGPREALLDGLVALALLIAMSLAAGLDTVSLAGTAVVSWAVWIGLGWLAGRSGSLTLAVQAAVLLALLGLGVFVLATGEPVSFWMPVLEALYADLSQQGLNIPADLPQQARIMSGGLLAFVLAGTLLALLFGLAWACGVVGRDIGDGFRSLRLGYVIGGLAAVAGLLALADIQLYGVLLIFAVAFTCQGAAVVAWWAQRLDWPRSWWLALVIPPLLLVEFLVVELAALAALGFVDNGFSLRRASDRG